LYHLRKPGARPRCSDRFPLSPTLANLAEGRDDIVVVEHAPKSVEEITDAVLEAVADEIHRLLQPPPPSALPAVQIAGCCSPATASRPERLRR